MHRKFPTYLQYLKWSFVNFLLLIGLLAVFFSPAGLGTSKVFAAPAPKVRVMAIPTFARKYGLPCSACHTAWPELNNFGQVFRDNGYQLMNERDSPIWQNPAYFPITFRITPNWHRESTDNQAIDSTPGGSSSGSTVSGRVTQAGFDLSGMDLWSAGTLYKNISFVLLPSSDPTAVWHFEAAWVRFDNLMGSSWLNLRAGRFELDNMISEKRFLFLSNNGGIYQIYHFNAPGSANNFGYGDNQIGLELAGHSKNSYTRYSVAVLSSNEGGVNFSTDVVPGAPPAGRSYDVNLAFSQAFNGGSLGLERVGAFSYIGQRSTYYQTAQNGAEPLVGLGNKPFYRVGVNGDFFLGKLELLPLYMHGWDNAYLGNGVPANGTLPEGAQAPTFNGGFVEGHYYVSPQLVFLGRYEKVNVGTQANIANPSSYGNVTAYSVGYRWYPIMFSRAGLAWHNEYSISKSIGIVPESGDGTGLPPLSLTNGVWSSSLLFGFDFDF
jgi:hypothetical protein